MLFVDPQEWEVTADQPGYDDEAKKNESDGADRSSALGDLFPVRALIHQLQRKKSSQLVCFALTRTLVSGRSVITPAKIRKIAFENGVHATFFQKVLNSALLPVFSPPRSLSGRKSREHRWRPEQRLRASRRARSE